jgi:diguanylate cyclase (GGDEF)-like protein
VASARPSPITQPSRSGDGALLPTLVDVLLVLTQRLTEDLPLEEALQAVTHAALEMIPSAEHASVRLLDDTQTELVSGARSGTGLGYAPMSFRRGYGIAGWVVEHEEVASVQDTARDERFVKGTNQGFAVRSILAVPMRTSGRVVGVLAVTGAQPKRFDGNDERLLRLLGNCAVSQIDKSRLERLAVTDELTRAFNYRYFSTRIEEEMVRSRRQGKPLSMMLLDIDHFKRINDQYGHLAGDRVLRVFADRVRATTRRYDVLVRRGGDEFIVIMPDTALDEAELAAHRVAACTRGEQIDADSHAVTATVSIGVVEWDGSEDVEQLQRRADRAAYKAKESDRNRVCLG